MLELIFFLDSSIFAYRVWYVAKQKRTKSQLYKPNPDYK